MTTEALFLPPLEFESGLEHSNQESSEVGKFRQMVGTKDVVKDVSITTESNNLLTPPLEDVYSLISKKSTPEELSNLIQKDAPVEKASSSPAIHGMNMAPVYNQLDQRQEDSQIKMPNVCSEQQEKASTSCQLEEGETGSCLECHNNILNVFPEFKHSNGTLMQEVQGVENKLYHCSDKVPVVPADFLKPLESVQEAKKDSLVYNGTISDIASEQQTSNDISNQPDQKIEDDTVDHSVKSFDAHSDSPEKPELTSSLKQIPACEEKSESLTSPKSLNLLCLETNCQNQAGERQCFISSHSNFDLTDELQRTFHPTNIREERKPSCQKITETGNEEIITNKENDQLLLASEDCQGHVNGQYLRNALEDNSQETGEQVTQDSSCSPNSSSLALAGSQLDVDFCCQQGASGTGCDTLPSKLLAQSPVATNDSCGPAHQGLAPVCDGQDREGLTIHKSKGAGNNDQSQGEVEAECVLESERQKEATRDSEPGENTSQPEEAENLSGANKLDEAFPDSQSLTGASDPTCPREAASAMVLASAEDLLDTRNRADSLTNASLANGLNIATEHSGSNPTPRKGLLLDVANPTSTTDLVNPEDPTLAAPPAEEHLVTEESDCPTDLMGNNTDEPENSSHATETPIEREIRLHLEREELLRRERGLGSSRGTQEYVEVCIKPILNQSIASSITPKEKERQWASVQMQREIQRECRREEDLMQLGKVRGTYDRGTPQELQEKKMIFKHHSHPGTPDFKKMGHSSRSPSCTENARGPPFAEVSWMPNVIIQDSGVAAQPKQHMPGTASLASPFFCLRAQSSQSLLYQEVREVQEREQELQRQRLALYGSSLPCHPTQDSNQDEEVPSPPERPSCKKLEVIWPPPSTSENIQVNGLHQVERSPRLLRRQRSALIQRWESGAIGNEENQD